MANLVPFTRPKRETSSAAISPRFVHRVQLDNRTGHPLAMEARVKTNSHGVATMVLTVEDAPGVDHA